GLVQTVDEVSQVIGSAESRGRGIISAHLVTPGAPEWMLSKRHEFLMCEAGSGHVFGEGIRDLTVSEALPPGAQVHFVDRHRLRDCPSGSALGHPRAILPGIR